MLGDWRERMHKSWMMRPLGVLAIIAALYPLLVLWFIIALTAVSVAGMAAFMKFDPGGFLNSYFD